MCLLTACIDGQHFGLGLVLTHETLFFSACNFPGCRQVDGMWREMMQRTSDAPSVIPIARERERVDKLVECNELLEAIQKGLAAYLEKKRLFFPRWVLRGWRSGRGRGIRRQFRGAGQVCL